MAGKRGVVGLTDYSTGEAVIFVLTEDIGQLLGLMEIVEFGTRFGRWSRHVRCGRGEMQRI